MIKEFFKKIIYGYRYNSDSYIKHLNDVGANIDKTAYFVAPRKVIIDETRPYLINIGAYVTITEGCKILTHGFDWSVLKNVYYEVIGSAGIVTIKDNCFIGVNTVILKGCTIGANTIIGAGSVVTKDIPANVVAAGNPCKVICTIDEYYEKRKKEYAGEAIQLIRAYYSRYKKIPPIEEMSEFFWLFENGGNGLKEEFIRKMKYGGDYESTIKKLSENKPIYNSYHELCKVALEEI